MRRHELTLSGMTLIGVLVGGGVLLGILGDHIDGSPVGGRPAAVETDSGLVIFRPDAFDTLQVQPPRGASEPGAYDWKEIARRNGRRFGLCHQSLVRAQNRLRRLGHHWNGERWVRGRR